MTLSQEELPDRQAKAAVAQTAGLEFHGINDAVVQFTPVDNYTGFTAEYAWIDNDLVVHFFLPPEASDPTKGSSAQWLDWWTTQFPISLDAAARQFFSADYPRLVAKYTAELTSWWFRAHGYGDVLDRDAFAIKFMKDLDAEIDRRQTQAG